MPLRPIRVQIIEGTRDLSFHKGIEWRGGLRISAIGLSSGGDIYTGDETLLCSVPGLTVSMSRNWLFLGGLLSSSASPCGSFQQRFLRCLQKTLETFDDELTHPGR